MIIDYIIVQAGGKGTRLGYLTKNKPKALVPVDNLPLLFHLFKKFPDKRFIIIADYKREVLRRYLMCFAETVYQIVDADGVGTCGGMSKALGLLPAGAPFLLIWSDIILPESFALPTKKGNYIGISETFACRWRYDNGIFEEKASDACGVAGLFVFHKKSCISDVPKNGEFVRYLSKTKKAFDAIGLGGAKEIGRLPEFNNIVRPKCRPFNCIVENGGLLTKEAINEQGRKLAADECAWYEFASSRGIDMIPKIYGVNPLKMEIIGGKNIYEYDDLSKKDKSAVLQKLVDALNRLHATANTPADYFSAMENYYGKTMRRLQQIRELLPFSGKKMVVINNKECRNIFYHHRELEQKLASLSYGCFKFIHGDCTFSNIMLRDGTTPVFIDPRGYFGYTKLYGDPVYDWAKLYYSIVGNYDRFNLGDFRLTLNKKSVELRIASNNWEDMESDFFKLTGADPAIVKLIHAVIWLSLSAYAWHDYDSICGAYYNGLYYMEDALC